MTQMYDIYFLLKLVIIFILAITIHELTHYIYAYWYHYNPKLEWEQGTPMITFDQNMSNSQQIIMYGSAILTGFIFINLFLSYQSNKYVYLIIIGLYLVGCGYDLYQLFMIFFYKNTNQFNYKL